MKKDDFLNNYNYLCRRFAALGNLKAAFIALVCIIFAEDYNFNSYK